MNLFENREFIGASGKPLTWRTECDAFTPMMWDWAAARILANCRYGFARVVPVPSKCLPGTRDNAEEIASRLEQHCTPGRGILVVDDVWTTGGSIIRTLRREGVWADEYGEPWVSAQIWVVFARTKIPHWAEALWHYGGNNQ